MSSPCCGSLSLFSLASFVHADGSGVYFVPRVSRLVSSMRFCRGMHPPWSLRSPSLSRVPRFAPCVVRGFQLLGELRSCAPPVGPRCLFPQKKSPKLLLTSCILGFHVQWLSVVGLIVSAPVLRVLWECVPCQSPFVPGVSLVQKKVLNVSFHFGVPGWYPSQRGPPC